MSIQVQAADPIVEKAARKLLGIEGVPKEEQTKMVRRALKAVAEMVAELRADAALGRAVREEMERLRNLRDDENSLLGLSDVEDEFLGELESLNQAALATAGMMEVEK